MPFPFMPAIMGGSALTGGLMNLFGHSKPSSIKKIPRFTGAQTDIMNRLAAQGMQNMDLGPIEQRARSMFQSQTVPSLAERFTSFGGGAGGQRSSAFMPAMFGAGADLEAQLAALRPQFGLQQLQMGLQPQFESIYRPSQPSAMQTFGSNLMGGAMSALGPALQGYNQESALSTLGQMQKGQQSDQFKALTDRIQQLENMLKGFGFSGGVA